METDCGPIVLHRADGSLATLCITGQPDRAVALKRRETSELIAEELRRLDPDEIYSSTLRFGVDQLDYPSGNASAPPTADPSDTGSPAAAAKKAPAKKAASK